MDFVKIATRSPKVGCVDIYPKFIIRNPSSDLMIRGSDFYAIWNENKGMWSIDEQECLALIDKELDDFYEENKEKYASMTVHVLHLWDADSGMIDKWHKYCQRQMRDSFHMLDEKIIFSNFDCKKEDYASKKLSYPLQEGKMDSYNRLMSVLYSEEERHKLEWAIGSIVSGASKELQKFIVLYGSGGTGKSTFIHIVEQLFDGYYTVFDAKALGSSNASFALEPFKTNPLVAIQHDGDLSKIEDNTRLNSLVSHELMTVNEKFKSAYTNRFKCFLFMGTNKPVKITDSRSGLIRRLIDVSPTGNILPEDEYRKCKNKIKFELGAIASHCLNVFEADPNAYEDYIPISMLDASNDFYNFIEDSAPIFAKEDGTTLKAAWEMYKNYCDFAKVQYPCNYRIFKEEMKSYFEDYLDRYTLEDGTRVRSWFKGFKQNKFEKKTKKKKEKKEKKGFIFEKQRSLLDEFLKDCPAQYANSDGNPEKKWTNVKTKLSDLDTSKLHYVKVPVNHIVIDFDIPDEHGNKCFALNYEAASQFPETYAELSKSGQGIHLHYLYSGDPEELSRVYGDHIEVKVFTGNSSLRRMVTECVNRPIATLSTGLPLKEVKKTVDSNTIKTEKGLISLIERNLKKEIHPGTKPSIDFIYKILEDAYESGLHYDVTNMKKDIMIFAANSTHQADYCLKLVEKMHFKSEEISEPVEETTEKPIAFFDIEIFPNLFLLCFKVRGEGKPIIHMINPSPSEITELEKYRLIGFNNKRYDNHICYACQLGYPVERLYEISKRLIAGDKTAEFGESRNFSYSDIYDFASASNKKSLKKLEIDMKMHHQELGFPWDKPVPENLWSKVADYCDNDVIATEAAFDYLEADWIARQILADLAGMTVNDSTNSLTQHIIFGNERNPQREFLYRDLSKPVKELDEEVIEFLKEACPVMMSQKHGKNKDSLLPYFDGYSFERGVSTYKGIIVGEGGLVYAEPGIYGDVALLDISSMHPHSTIAECLFGVRYTKAYREIVEGRVSIKHQAWNEIDNILGGKLKPYIQRVLNGEFSAKDLANALKTAINAVYGQTAAGYPNAFKDPRNKDNIVAKRGALFMIDLMEEVKKRGFKVAHIKTDSIKIPDATPEIIEFVMNFGRKYGYEFEHEATYEKMCLINDAVYIAKYKDGPHEYTLSTGEKIMTPWTATGTQFAVPYVFKTLFSHDSIDFYDLCETKSVTSNLYLDMNENLPQLTPLEEKELTKLDKLIKSEEPLSSEQIARHAELTKKEEEAHNYIFVGKVGLFCPMKDGAGGGLLMREKDGKYYAATGTKGYRWLESEVVQSLHKEDDIDRTYYNFLVDDAINVIERRAQEINETFDWFASDAPYIGPDEVPFVAN